jgi:hypothetical protein
VHADAAEALLEALVEQADPVRVGDAAVGAGVTGWAAKAPRVAMTRGPSGAVVSVGAGVGAGFLPLPGAGSEAAATGAGGVLLAATARTQLMDASSAER